MGPHVGLARGKLHLAMTADALSDSWQHYYLTAVACKASLDCSTGFERLFWAVPCNRAVLGAGQWQAAPRGGSRRTEEPLAMVLAHG